jgi:hypothetical protein
MEKAAISSIALPELELLALFLVGGKLYEELVKYLPI